MPSSSSALAAYTQYHPAFLPRVKDWEAKVNEASVDKLAEDMETVSDWSTAPSGAAKGKGKQKQANISFFKCEPEKLPKQLQYQEGTAAYREDGVKLSERFSIVHKRYGGKDRYSTGGRSNRNTFDIQKSTIVSVMVADSKGNITWHGDITAALPNIKDAKFKSGKRGADEAEAGPSKSRKNNEDENAGGSRDAGDKKEEDSAWTPKLSMFTDSMQPSLDLRIVSGVKGEKNVFCKMFADDLVQGEGLYGVGLDMLSDIRGEHDLIRDDILKSANAPPGLQALLDAKAVFETRLHPKQSRRGRHLRWSNIPGKDLDRIREGKDLRTETEKLVYRLEHAARISMYRMCYDKEGGPSSADLIEKLSSYMMSAMRMVQEDGDWSYYRRCIRYMREERGKPALTAKEELMFIDEYAEAIPPPRHMATGYEVMEVNGKPVIAWPITTASFADLGAYKTNQGKLFIMMLNNQRKCLLQEQKLKEMNAVIRGRGPTVAIKVSPFNPRLYSIEVWVPKAKDSDEQVELPKADVQVEIIVDGQQRKLKGKTMDNYTKSSDLLIAAIGRPGQAFEGRKTAQIEFIDNPTPLVRVQNALERMIHNQKRTTTGADIPSLILDSPEVVANHGYFSREYCDERGDQYENCVQGYGLNEAQEAAALAPLEALLDDHELLWGPAGTGKTNTAAVMIAAMLNSLGGLTLKSDNEYKRTKVMIVAEGHAAADNALTTLRRVLGPNHPFRLVRYKKSFDTKSTAKKNQEQSYAEAQAAAAAKVNDTQSTEEAIAAAQLERVAWKVVESALEEKHTANSDLAFGKLLDDCVTKWAGGKDCSPELRAAAAEYIRLDKILSGDMSGYSKASADKLVAQYDDALEYVEKAFLQDVDVIVCTSSASVSDKLVDWFNFDVFVVEEAGQASVDQMLVSMAAHMDKIKFMLVSGDHKQLDPTSTATNMSEGARAGSSSLWEKLWSDPHHRGIRHELNVQYRQMSDLANLVGPIFYPKKGGGSMLVSAPGLDDMVEDDVFFQKAVEKLAPLFGDGDTSMGGEDNDNEFARAQRSIQTSGIAPTTAKRAVPQLLAFDVSKGHSEHYADGTSWCNQEEADRLVNFACHFFDQKVNGKTPSPKSMCLLVPYSGQRNLIRETFRARNRYDLLSADDGVDMVSNLTVPAAQGSEWSIILISCVMNLEPVEDKRGPGAVGWMGGEGLQCSMLTRGRRAVVIFGNFMGWLKADESKNSVPWQALKKDSRRHMMDVVKNLQSKKLILSDRNLHELFDDSVSQVTTRTFELELAAEDKFPEVKQGGSSDHQAVRYLRPKGGRWDTKPAGDAAIEEVIEERHREELEKMDLDAKCDICKQTGHSADNCRQNPLNTALPQELRPTGSISLQPKGANNWGPPPTGKTSWFAVFKIPCQKCGELGHGRPSCQKKAVKPGKCPLCGDLATKHFRGDAQKCTRCSRCKKAGHHLEAELNPEGIGCPIVFNEERAKAASGGSSSGT